MKENSNLRLIVMPNFLEFGKKVDAHLKLMRGIEEEKFSFIVPIDLPRFNSGDGKAVIKESTRAKDMYILSDVYNYSCTYTMHGFTNHKSPDDHYQDIKRVISAMNGSAESIKVIMPLLYASRQHKRKGRESRDCSLMLHELEFLDIDGVITFDAHDPTIQNAVQHCFFENPYPTYSILNQVIDNENIDFNNLLVVSPDSGAIDRALYYADMLGTDVGIYHKRRDYSKVENGKNPIVAHEYMGASVDGKTVIIVDDMIDSGQSMLDVAIQMKSRGAKTIYLISSFTLFGGGEKNVNLFQDAYNNKIFDKLYTTNLSYVPKETKQLEWFQEVDCSKYIASIINNLNHHESISPLLNGKEKILQKINNAKQKTSI